MINQRTEEELMEDKRIEDIEIELTGDRIFGHNKVMDDLEDQAETNGLRFVEERNGV